MRGILGLALIGLAAVILAPPAIADEQTGKVSEIIIKIETPDGPRWYKLGADLSKIDVREGAVVRFNYADDTIDTIEVEEVSPSDAQSTE